LTMNLYKFLILSILLVMSLLQRSDATGSKEAVDLNSEGNALMQNTIGDRKDDQMNVFAKNLTNSDWQSIFEKYKAALKADPQYAVARRNLAVAHNNFALYLAQDKHKRFEALEQFHQALYTEPDQTIIQNMLVLIRRMGKNPDSFGDRVELGDMARTHNDIAGAIVEYEAALKLKRDPEVQKKLNDAYGIRPASSN
jgi:tetratricopeptide (TPR) repeat protein